MSDDKPVNLGGRKPRIAPDEGNDPIQPKEQTQKKPGRKQKDVVVQFSTRISLSTRELIDDIVDEQGITVREVVEQAVNAHWKRQ